MESQLSFESAVKAWIQNNVVRGCAYWDTEHQKILMLLKQFQNKNFDLIKEMCHVKKKTGTLIIAPTCCIPGKMTWIHPTCLLPFQVNLNHCIDFETQRSATEMKSKVALQTQRLATQKISNAAFQIQKQSLEKNIYKKGFHTSSFLTTTVSGSINGNYIAKLQTGLEAEIKDLIDSNGKQYQGPLKIQYNHILSIKDPKKTIQYPPLLTKDGMLKSYSMGTLDLRDSDGNKVYSRQPYKCRQQIQNLTSQEAEKFTFWIYNPAKRLWIQIQKNIYHKQGITEYFQYEMPNPITLGQDYYIEQFNSIFDRIQIQNPKFKQILKTQQSQKIQIRRQKISKPAQPPTNKKIIPIQQQKQEYRPPKFYNFIDQASGFRTFFIKPILNVLITQTKVNMYFKNWGFLSKYLNLHSIQSQNIRYYLFPLECFRKILQNVPYFNKKSVYWIKEVQKLINVYNYQIIKQIKWNEDILISQYQTYFFSQKTQLNNQLLKQKLQQEQRKINNKQQDIEQNIFKKLKINKQQHHDSIEDEISRISKFNNCNYSRFNGSFMNQIMINEQNYGLLLWQFFMKSLQRDNLQKKFEQIQFEFSKEMQQYNKIQIDRTISQIETAKNKLYQLAQTQVNIECLKLRRYSESSHKVMLLQFDGTDYQSKIDTTKQLLELEREKQYTLNLIKEYYIVKGYQTFYDEKRIQVKQNEEYIQNEIKKLNYHINLIDAILQKITLPLRGGGSPIIEHSLKKFKDFLLIQLELGQIIKKSPSLLFIPKQYQQHTISIKVPMQHLKSMLWLTKQQQLIIKSNIAQKSFTIKTLSQSDMIQLNLFYSQEIEKYVSKFSTQIEKNKSYSIYSSKQNTIQQIQNFKTKHKKQFSQFKSQGEKLIRNIEQKINKFIRVWGQRAIDRKKLKYDKLFKIISEVEKNMDLYQTDYLEKYVFPMIKDQVNYSVNDIIVKALKFDAQYDIRLSRNKKNLQTQINFNPNLKSIFENRIKQFPTKETFFSHFNQLRKQFQQIERLYCNIDTSVRLMIAPLSKLKTFCVYRLQSQIYQPQKRKYTLTDPTTYQTIVTVLSLNGQVQDNYNGFCYSIINQIKLFVLAFKSQPQNNLSCINKLNQLKIFISTENNKYNQQYEQIKRQCQKITVNNVKIQQLSKSSDLRQFNISAQTHNSNVQKVQKQIQQFIGNRENLINTIVQKFNKLPFVEFKFLSTTGQLHQYQIKLMQNFLVDVKVKSINKEIHFKLFDQNNQLTTLLQNNSQVKSNQQLKSKLDELIELKDNKNTCLKQQIEKIQIQIKHNYPSSNAAAQIEKYNNYVETLKQKMRQLHQLRNKSQIQIQIKLAEFRTMALSFEENNYNQNCDGLIEQTNKMIITLEKTILPSSNTLRYEELQKQLIQNFKESIYDQQDQQLNERKEYLKRQSKNIKYQQYLNKIKQFKSQVQNAKLVQASSVDSLKKLLQDKSLRRKGVNLNSQISVEEYNTFSKINQQQITQFDNIRKQSRENINKLYNDILQQQALSEYQTSITKLFFVHMNKIGQLLEQVSKNKIIDTSMKVKITSNLSSSMKDLLSDNLKSLKQDIKGEDLLLKCSLIDSKIESCLDLIKNLYQNLKNVANIPLNELQNKSQTSKLNEQITKTLADASSKWFRNMNPYLQKLFPLEIEFLNKMNLFMQQSKMFQLSALKDIQLQNQIRLNKKAQEKK